MYGYIRGEIKEIYGNYVVAICLAFSKDIICGVDFAFSSKTASGGRWNSEKLISFSLLESKNPAAIPLSSNWAKAVAQKPVATTINKSRLSLFIMKFKEFLVKRSLFG